MARCDFLFSSEPDATAAVYLTRTLIDNLSSGKTVLWLISGGSNIATAVAVSHGLGRTPTDSLTVMLTDERYGEVGHSNSNWQQLLDAGFEPSDADLIPTLQGGSQAETVVSFAKDLSSKLSRANFRIGLFGLGADGHTAGILPHSPALNATGYAVGYEASDYRRITMTGSAIAHLDEAVLVASGPTKWPALAQLRRSVAPEYQPAQLLKSIKLQVISDNKDL